jgi:hypothetical protein
MRLGMFPQERIKNPPVATAPGHLSQFRVVQKKTAFFIDNPSISINIHLNIYQYPSIS